MWLLPYKPLLLKRIHPAFNDDGISAIDTESGLLIGRTYGGLVVLWKKLLNIDMNIIKYEDDRRLIGIHIKSTKHHLSLLNAYMPTESEENLDNFTFYMYKIYTIFRNNATVNNIAIGDFNTKLRKASLFSSGLHRFVSNNGYLISDKQILLPDTFTFYSAAH